MRPPLIQFECLKNAHADLEPHILAAVAEVVSSGVYINGPQLAAFENEFADKLGLDQVVGVGNGYDAITLALLALGLTGGEIILPSNTYMATALAAVRAGLTPVFAEPDPTTLLLDPGDIEKRLTPRTVAILPVHLFGLSCDMGAICEIADRRKLAIVEDCAQAHGAVYKGRSVGTFGLASAWSFYPTKNLGALGDAGAVSSRLPEVIGTIKVLRNYGARERACAECVGLNSRLDEVQAAILRVKLSALDGHNTIKNAIASRYDRDLRGDFGRPAPVSGSLPARSVYPILHPKRDELAAYLESRAIKTAIHYPVPPYRQKALAAFARGRYPVSDALHGQTLSLPLSVALSEMEIDRIIEAVNSFQG